MKSCSGSGGSFSFSTGGRKMERKDKERERRQQMKELCFHLFSLISPFSSSSSTSKDVMTQKDNFDEAVTYILKLKERVEKLRKMRDSKSSIMIRGTKRNISRSNPASNKMAVPPVIEVRSEDTNLEVVLVSSLHDGFKLHQVIGILEEEGALVKNANFSVVSDKVFCTVHSQALSPRIGVEASRVLERLQDLVS